VNSRWTIDGSPRSNTARYINHSCRPNADPMIRDRRIWIKAIRNIEPGDEITYDYGKDHFNAYIKPHGCRCDKCRAKRRKARAEARAANARKRKRAARLAQAERSQSPR
jgi:SET domain-containing protein